MNERRGFLTHASRLAVASALPLGLARPVQAATPVRVAISVPGPGTLLYLPTPLAQKIGADRAEGVELDIRYISGGGPLAYRAMLERNSDFATGGLAALALQRINGKPVTCIAPITQVPAYTLVVSRKLQRQVKVVADLRGRVVGVRGYVPGGRSTSQLFTEYLLQREGVRADQANFVAVGQDYPNQHAALASGTVDAIMADEPFASRLVQEKVAFVLADFHDQDAVRKLLGGLFLNGVLATRDDVIASQPMLVEKMVKVLKRTLVWIHTRSAAEMTDAMNPSTPQERAALLAVLKVRKNIFSPDGTVSTEQVETVQRFVRATEKTAAAQAFNLRSMVDARWAGSST